MADSAPIGTCRSYCRLKVGGVEVYRNCSALGCVAAIEIMPANRGNLVDHANNFGSLVAIYFHALTGNTYT